MSFCLNIAFMAMLRYVSHKVVIAVSCH